MFPGALWWSLIELFHFQSPSGKNEIHQASWWWNLLMWCFSKLLIKHMNMILDIKTWKQLKLSQMNTYRHYLLSDAFGAILAFSFFFLTAGS